MGRSVFPGSTTPPSQGGRAQPQFFFTPHIYTHIVWRRATRSVWYHMEGRCVFLRSAMPHPKGAGLGISAKILGPPTVHTHSGRNNQILHADSVQRDCWSNWMWGKSLHSWPTVNANAWSVAVAYHLVPSAKKMWSSVNMLLMLRY